MLPRGRRRRGLMTRRLTSTRKHRRLFAKWRRAVLRRFLPRPTGRRRERPVRLDAQAVFFPATLPVNISPRTFSFSPRVADARVLR
jgi:hypothetical protein